MGSSKVENGVRMVQSPLYPGGSSLSQFVEQLGIDHTVSYWPTIIRQLVRDHFGLESCDFRSRRRRSSDF